MLATQTGQLDWILHAQERIESRAHYVVRIRRAQHFRAHISDTHCLHNRSDRTARDNACAFRRRLHEDTTCTVLTNQLMRQRVIDLWNSNQVLLGRLDTFLDRQWHFARFASTKTDVPTFVAYYYERGEREVLTTFYDLGDAIDRNHLVFKIEPLGRNALLGLSHSLFLFLLPGLLFRWLFGFWSRLCDFRFSDHFVLVQACCTRGIGQGLPRTAWPVAVDALLRHTS